MVGEPRNNRSYVDTLSHRVFYHIHQLPLTWRPLLAQLRPAVAFLIWCSPCALWWSLTCKHDAFRQQSRTFVPVCFLQPAVQKQLTHTHTENVINLSLGKLVVCAPTSNATNTKKSIWLDIGLFFAVSPVTPLSPFPQREPSALRQFGEAKS